MGSLNPLAVHGHIFGNTVLVASEQGVLVITGVELSGPLDGLLLIVEVLVVLLPLNVSVSVLRVWLLLLTWSEILDLWVIGSLSVDFDPHEVLLEVAHLLESDGHPGLVVEEGRESEFVISLHHGGESVSGLALDPLVSELHWLLILCGNSGYCKQKQRFHN